MNNTVIKTIDILNHISQHCEGLTLTELVTLTGYPKSSVFDILSALESKAMVFRKGEKSNIYAIGYRAFAIGDAYSRSSNLLANSLDCIKLLGEKLNRTVFISRNYDNNVIYVGKYEPKSSLLVTPEIGNIDKLETTSMGKIFSVYETDHEMKQFLTDSEIAEMRSTAVASFGIDETSVIYSLSSPIFNYMNRLVGVVSILGINHKNNNYEEEKRQLKLCAVEIARRLGFEERRVQEVYFPKETSHDIKVSDGKPENSRK